MRIDEKDGWQLSAVLKRVVVILVTLSLIVPPHLTASIAWAIDESYAEDEVADTQSDLLDEADIAESPEYEEEAPIDESSLDPQPEEEQEEPVEADTSQEEVVALEADEVDEAEEPIDIEDVDDDEEVNATSVDGFLSIKLYDAEDSQTVPFTAPLTGYYTLQLSRDDEYEEVNISLKDITEDVQLGSLTVNATGEASEPLIYLEKLHDYDFTFTTTDADGVTDALSLVRATTQAPNTFTIEDGVITGYTGKLLNIQIPEGVTSITDEACDEIAGNTGYYGQECTAYINKVSLFFPASMSEISAEQLNYHNMYKSQVPAVSLNIAPESNSYKTVDGMLYSKDGSTLVAAPAGRRGSIVVPEGVTTIGTYAFAYGSATEVELPETVETIEQSAFENSDVKEIVLPDSVKTIANRAFGYVGWSGSSKLQKVTFGSGLETIAPYAFEGMLGKTIVLPESLESVGQGAFEDCPNLKTLTITGTTSIDGYVFSGCENLETLVIEDNATLSGSAFEDCPKLKNFEVGDKATDWQVVDGCLIEKGLSTRLFLAPASSEPTEFVIPDNVDSVSGYALQNISEITRLTIGKKCTDCEGALSKNLEAIYVSEGNPTYSVHEGVLYQRHFVGWGWDDNYEHEIQIYSDTKFDLVRYPMSSHNSTYTVGPEVACIEYGAFANRSENMPRNLVKVTVPFDTEIEYGAFSTCCTEGETQLTIAGYNGSKAQRYCQEYADAEHLKWEGTTLTVKVTFDANGGTIGSATKKVITVNYDEAVSNIPTPTRANYVFLGWYSERTGGYRVEDDDLYWEDETVYAHWRAATTTYTVTFNGNGGTPSKKSMTVKKGSKIGTLPTATRKGYFFVGWFTAKSGGTKVNSSTIITKKQTLYAHWARPDLSNAKVSVASCTWNGKRQKPAVTVTLQGTKLKEGTHYTTPTYTNNIEPGKGKVTITGKGQFKGSKKMQSFTISKAKQTITASDVTYAASASGTKKTLSVKVKEKARITLKSSNTKVVTTARSGCAVTLKEPGSSTITITAAETAHYKSAKKNIKVLRKGNQKITFKSSILTYNRTDKCYDLSGAVLSRSMGVYVYDNARYTCRIYLSGAKNHPWIESGDKLTVKGSGKFVVQISVDETQACPAICKTFTIRLNGINTISSNCIYRQLSKDTISLEEWLGSDAIVRVPNTITLKNGSGAGSATKKITQVANSAFSKNATRRIKFTEIDFQDGSITKIGNSAFASCTYLTTVRLPIGLTSLGEQAFAGCTALKNIELPDTLKTLSVKCFDGCSALGPYFYLPSSLTTIKTGALQGCSGIKRLMVYGYLNLIDYNAFKGCTALSDIYYSGSAERWTNVRVSPMGNEAFNNARKHFNSGVIGVPSVTDISDETLYRDYPGYLTNDNFEFVLNSLDVRLKETNAETPESKVMLSALKTMMQEGALSASVSAIIDDIYHWDHITGEVSDTWTEQQTNKSLAMELVLELSQTDSMMDTKDKYKKRANNILEIAKTAKDVGDCVFVKKENGKVVRDNTARWRFAQELDKYFKGSQSSQINDMLTAIQDNWELISGLTEGTEYAIDAIDYATTVLILHEYCRVYIEDLLLYIPEGCPLRSGLLLLKQDIDAPLETYVKKLIREGGIKLVGKVNNKMLQVVASGGATEVADLIFKLASLFIFDTPTIDAYNKAWLSTLNAQMLHAVVREKSLEIQSLTDADYRWNKSSEYQLLCTVYFKSLEKASEYVAACKNDHDSAYLRQMFARYKETLTYDDYIRSCKEMLIESGAYV